MNRSDLKQLKQIVALLLATATVPVWAATADPAVYDIDEVDTLNGVMTGSGTGPLIYTVIALPASGVFGHPSPLAGDFTYTPSPGASITDSFQFRVTDSIPENSPAATVTININRRPTANPQSGLNTDEDTPLDITVSGGDPNGDTLTYNLATGPSFGSIIVAGDTFTYTPDPEYSGPDSFTFTASDATLTSLLPAPVDITVDPVNDLPTAADLSVSTDEDTPVDGVFLGDDPVEGSPLTYSVSSGPSQGTVTISGADFTYTPNANSFGPDSFEYVANDGSDDSAPATVTVAINSINDLPTAGPVSVSTNEDTPVDGVFVGDDPVEGSPLTYSVSSGPSQGTVSISGADFTYTPNANSFGPDSFEYVANDGSDDSAPATVTVTINSINDLPTAADLSVSTDEDTAVDGVFVGDDPVEGSPLTYSVSSGPSQGTVSISGADFTYTPNANSFGPDSFEYVANDGSDDSAPATVTVAINSINDLPTAGPVSVSTNEDTPVDGVFVGDDPVEGSPLTYSVSSGPSQGTVTISGADFTYTPNANSFGPDSFEYVANDGSDDSAPALVTVTINPINDPPTAGPVSVTTDEDTPGNGVFVGDDPVEGSPLTYSVSSGPSQGTVTISGADFTYTPDPDTNGSDSFEYVANDGSDDSAPATVTVAINPINDQPTADNQSVATNEDTPLSDSVTGGDVDGDGLTFAQASGPASGTLTLNADGTFTYSPDLNFFGSDSFSFTASDGTLTSATAVVDITVNPINDAPVADPQTLVTDEDTALSGAVGGTDVEGDTLTYAVLTAPTSGALALSPDGSFTYTPSLNFNGSDSFQFFANDGALDSAAATIDITVNPVNDAPEVVGVPPSVLTTEDSGGVSLSLVGLFGDVDAATNGDTYVLSVTGTSGSVLQSADIVGMDLDLLFVPNENGTASVTVTATDTGGLTADVLIDIEVTPVNDAPTVVGSVPDVVEDEDAADTTVSFATVFEDVDIATNGDVLTLSVSAVAGGGFFESITPSGDTIVLSYLPDQFGTATLTVRATDLAGNFTEYLLNVTVNSVNDAPFVANPIGDVNTFEDAPPFTVNLSLLFDDVDIDTNGDFLTLSLGSVGNSALFDSIDVVGTELQVTLAADESGSSLVTIRAEDSFGEFETYTFSIDAISVNDEPVAADDTAVMDEDGGPLSISVLDNDYLAEEPTIITSAGFGGYSESEPVIIIDPLGDPIGGPNGQVAITGTTITYEPKADFNGVDYFSYAITDVNGDTVSGTVTITVNPVNDPPTTSQQTITHDMLENSILVVDAASADGVLTPSYDTEASVADASGNPIGGVTLSANVVTPPAVGSLTFDSVTGAYEFTPPIDFTGLVSFTYRLYDGSDESNDFTVQVNVIPAPPAPEPPPAGEVSILYNLSNVPLEQSASVPANVLVLMDDSGSMDWNMIVNGDDENGGFVLSNESRANGGRYSTTYVYLYDITTNAYPPSSDSGRVVPTEEALDLEPLTVGNEYGVWRARSSLYNKLYYNPEIQYEPWIGLDVTNTDFANADPTAVRLDPRSTANTINLEGDVFSWDSTNVPQWDDNGGRTRVDVDNLYIPYYYATTASPPLAWDSPHTKIEIRPGTGPLAGGLFPGGSERGDCRVGDDNPFACTYTQEMQNFANWFQYYRSREYVTKDSIGKVIAAVQDIRVGYETVSNTTSEPIRPMNDLYSEGNKRTLLDNVYDVDSYGGTPLRQLLGRAGRTFGCLSGGDCPALPAPDGMCQQNFALLFSDGYWNGGAGVPSNTDVDGDRPFDGGRYADNVNATLADTAMYYYENDLFDTVDDRVPVSSRDENGAPAGTFSAANPTMHQHMKTYAIAFGVSGSINPADVPTDPTTPFAWTNPTTAPAHKIDDMLHAAVNGRGSYLNASNPRELRSAFEQAFLEFTQASSSTSAAAFNSTSLRDGTLLYRGFYDLRDNTGELTATEVFTDGTLAAAPTWRASEMLNPANRTPEGRVIVTFDRGADQGVPFRYGSLSPEQQLSVDESQVNFLRGVRTNEAPAGAFRERPAAGGLLGDIVNSSPVFVGTPRGFNRDQAPYPVGDLYSDFVAARATREPMVYVGANDGILHGFNAQTGLERYGFVPNKILDSTQSYASMLEEFTSPFYLHQYYVDLTPRLNDVYTRASAAVVGKSWNTVLVGGLGVGGKGFFALNVDDPTGNYNNELNAARTVLWEFTDEDDTYPVDGAGTPLEDVDGNPLLDPLGQPVKDLGYATSLPTVAMTNADDGTEKEWAAIFGNGLNSTAGIAKLFVLFMDRGIDGWDSGDVVKLDTGYGVPVAPDPDAGYPNGLGSVAVVDRDLNGTGDWVYAGDRMGNLHRFDISDPDPDNWTSTLLFTASYDDGTTITRQPILARPLVVKHPTETGFLVIFGTGSHVAREDSNNEDIQSIYAIWDRGESNPATAFADSKSLRLVEQEITNLVDDSVSPAQGRRAITSNDVNYTPESGTPGTYGWYIDFDMQRATDTLSGAPNPDTSGYAPPDTQYPGEKAIRRLLYRDGTVITTTILPSIGEASCFGARPGSIILFDAVNGGNPTRAVVDFNNDGVVDSGDLVEDGGEQFAAGLLFNQEDLDGTLVDLSTLGGEGDTDFLFVSGGSETTSFRIDDINDSRTGRLSWRELEQ